MEFWTSLLSDVHVVIPLVIGAVLTYAATSLTDRRASRRAAAAQVLVDRAARFEAGQLDARKSLKLTEKLIMYALNAQFSTLPDSEPVPPAPLHLDVDLLGKLTFKVRLIPDSAVAERLSWLLQAAVDPRSYSPDPLLTNFPFFQIQCLGYVGDDLARFVRRDAAVDPKAEALARNIEKSFQNRWNPESTP